MPIKMAIKAMWDIIRAGGGDKEIALLIAQNVQIIQSVVRDKAALLAMIDLGEELAPDLKF